MRIVLSIFILLPVLGWSQPEEDRKLLGFGVEGVLNVLEEPTLSFSEYKSVINDPVFFLHSELTELLSSSRLFTRNGVAVRIILKGPDFKKLGAFKRSQFNLGALYNGGNNYSFNFHRVESVRLDTITMISSTGTIETLYGDTVYYHDTEYLARSQNLGVYGEFLVYKGEGVLGFATGLGLAADITLFYEAEVRQTLNYATALFHQNGTVAYAPLTDNQDPGTVSLMEDNSRKQRISAAYFIRPYIPVRIETNLSNGPKMEHFTIDINAKIGTEIQISPGASVNARMFYSLGLGLNYHL